MENIDDNSLQEIFLECPERVEEMAVMNMKFRSIILSHPILRIILEVGWCYEACCRFADLGILDGLKYVQQHGLNLNSAVVIAAARGGHIDCLKYILENIIQSAYWFDAFSTLGEALKSGHLECAHYVWKNYCPEVVDAYIIDSLSNDAVVGGNVKCLAFVVDVIGAQMNDGCIYSAVHDDNYECYKYLVEHFDDEQSYIVAAECGKLDFMKCAFDLTHVCHSEAVARAIKNKHYDCALYAIKHGSLIPEKYIRWMEFMKLNPDI